MTRRGIVSAVARALTGVALAIDGVTGVEIHCDEANRRSAAVARRIGFRLDRIEVDRVSAPGDLGRSMIGSGGGRVGRRDGLGGWAGLMVWGVGRRDGGEV